MRCGTASRQCVRYDELHFAPTDGAGCSLQVEELVSSVLLADRADSSHNVSNSGGDPFESSPKSSTDVTGTGEKEKHRQDVAVFVGVAIHGPEHPRNELVRPLGRRRRLAPIAWNHWVDAALHMQATPMLTCSVVCTLAWIHADVAGAVLLIYRWSRH